MNESDVNMLNVPAQPQPVKWKWRTARFLFSQILSLFGSSLVQYALMWHITLSTGSSLMMTVYIILGFLPSFFLSPFAGVWADRYNRKLLMVIADGSIAAATLVLALVYRSGAEELWLLFAVAAVRSLGQGVHGPAVGAALPQIVPIEHLARVNGINGTIQSVMMLVSPIIAAALLASIPLSAIFMIDVVTAALAILLLILFIPIPDHGRVGKTDTASQLRDLQDGFRYVKNHGWLVLFFLFNGFLLFLIAPAAFLTPLQTVRNFGDEIWRLSALEIAFSLGMIVGGLLLSLWGGFKNRMYSLYFSSLIMGLCTFALSLAGNFWLYLGFMGVFGLALPYFNAPSMTMIQEHVEENYLGRVFSVFTMLSTSMMPLGMLAFGPVADVLSIDWILSGTGVSMLILVILFSRSRVLKKAGKAPAATAAEAS